MLIDTAYTKHYAVFSGGVHYLYYNYAVFSGGGHYFYYTRRSISGGWIVFILCTTQYFWVDLKGYWGILSKYTVSITVFILYWEDP